MAKYSTTARAVKQLNFDPRHLFSGQSEEEEVVIADLLANFDVGAAQL